MWKHIWNVNQQIGSNRWYQMKKFQGTSRKLYIYANIWSCIEDFRGVFEQKFWNAEKLRHV